MKDTSLQHMTHQSQCTVYITVHNCTIFLEQNGVQECMLIVVLLVCSLCVCASVCMWCVLKEKWKKTQQDSKNYRHMKYDKMHFIFLSPIKGTSLIKMFFCSMGKL